MKEREIRRRDESGKTASPMTTHDNRPGPVGRSVVAAALLGICLFLLPAQSARGAEAAIRIVGVTVLPMTGEGPLVHHRVEVRGDRITAVTADAATTGAVVDAAVLTVDGRGLFVIPGLVDMHGHLPPYPSSPQEAEDTLFLFLAHGVTTVRNMLARPGHLQLRERILREELWAPSLYLAGWGFSGNVTSDEDAVRRVEQQKAEGWDLLKIFDGLTASQFEAVARRATEVGISFAGHVPREVGIEGVLQSGIRTIEHLDGYVAGLDGQGRRVSDDALRTLARKTREAGVGVVPTMAVWEHLLFATPAETVEAYEELAYVPRQVRAAWRKRLYDQSPSPLVGLAKSVLGIHDPRVVAENRLRLLKIMDEEGVEILFGTDSPQFYSVPGFSVFREAAKMRSAGLANRRILETATAAAGAHLVSGPASRQAPEAPFGMIEVGARADLVLLGGNPLEDLHALRDIRGVMVRGRWLGRQEIERGLADIRRRIEAAE